MTFWKITLSYDGSSFHGWQVQPDSDTVQGTLAAAIERITGERVLPQGAGRTDAGVHALAQVASFALAVPIPPANLLRALNRTLPRSIRVLAAERVEPSFHARHNALRKTYEYRIFERTRTSIENARAPQVSLLRQGSPEIAVADRICPPFLAPFVCDCRWPLNVELMERAAALLVGTHDFTSFAACDPDRAQRSDDLAAPNPVKTIFAFTLQPCHDLLVYSVTGSGFLHHMVRNIVGTLVEIGRGSLGPLEIPSILARRDRSAAGPTAPACGLFLVSVDYGQPALARSTQDWLP